MTHLGPMPTEAKGDPISQTLSDPNGSRLAHLLRPHSGRLGIVLLLLTLLVGTNLVLPYSVKLLIDDVFPSGDRPGNWSLLWFILPALGLIYVARNALFYPSRMLSVRVSEDVCFSLRRRLFEYLQQLNLRFYKVQQPGKVGSRLLDDTFKIQVFIQEKLPVLMLNLLMVQVLLVILYAVNWRLALATSIVLPAHFLTYWAFKGPIKSRHSEAQENVAAAYGNVVEKFLGVEVVKGFTGEQRERDRFHKAIDASRTSQIRTQRYQFMQKVVADLLVGAGIIFLFGFGAWQVMHGGMTGGTFIMFFGYVGMLYPAVLEVISGTSHLSKTTACIDRVYEMLDEPGTETGPQEESDGRLVPREGRIEFRNVTFGYEGGRPVLRNVSLSIGAGECIAITGPSGTGKSTLVNMLLRFIDPTAGQVLIDGRDVRSYPIQRLRGAIGMAFQEIFLFNASVKENLRYARPEATMEEIEDVCMLTGAHRCVEQRPEGYETRLGAAGGDLSRGERQRINLARALLKDPLILILDEATASIDNHSSRAIMEEILQRTRGRTILMITHKPDLLELADRVVILRDGRVEFEGPHSEAVLTEHGVVPGRAGICDVSPKRAGSVGEGTRVVRVEPFDGEPDLDEEPGQREDAREQSHAGGLAGLILLPLLLLIGCVSQERSVKSFEMERPMVNTGLLALEPTAEEMERAAVQWSIAGEPRRDRADWLSRAEAVAAFDPVARGVERVPRREPVGADGRLFPSEAGRLVALPKLSATEIGEIIESISLRFQTEGGYQPAPAELAADVPAVPQGVMAHSGLMRHGADGRRDVLRFGFRRYLSQPPQLWVHGVVLSDGEPIVNPDIETIPPAVEHLVASLTEMRANMTHDDLATQIIQLSYVDTPSALTALKGLGVHTITDANEVPADIEHNRLPLVVAMPTPKPDQIGLVGEQRIDTGQFGLSMLPTTAAQLHHDAVMSPSSQLLVLYDPARPGQFSRVRALLSDIVDRPARQIFVEGMVLEISEDGLKELGIEWEFQGGTIEWMLGKMVAGGPGDVLRFSHVDSRDAVQDWSVRLRALIREGKAEVLSRPSILTVDNRQATIRVGEDIPIATSMEGTHVARPRIAFTFNYLPIGILLNVRPRISERGNEVSMLIDTIVSAVVPGRDLEIRSEAGEVLASAPTISTRRVQTYSRIENNTPFIIGGLVSRDQTVTQDKVPILGDLPLIGAAFRAERSRLTKREVIIVLTPYVLPEDDHIARSLPKDEDFFDSFGHQLFRDSYRIRTDDVFDLEFLLENQRLQSYQKRAEQAIAQDYRLARRPPLDRFADGRIPGEDVLVHRMIYEVVKRLDRRGQQMDLEHLIHTDRIIFFESQQVGGFNVQFLDRVMSRLGGGREHHSFFRTRPGEALALTFSYDRETNEADRLASEPIPEVSIVECPDRREWSRLLWELNQPAPDGRRRFTILLNSESDMVRLRRALMLKRVIALNGGPAQQTLTNFGVGKTLLMPEIKPGQTLLIDADVARLFFHTEHYYAAAIQEIESAITAVEEHLGRR